MKLIKQKIIIGLIIIVIILILLTLYLLYFNKNVNLQNKTLYNKETFNNSTMIVMGVNIAGNIYYANKDITTKPNWTKIGGAATNISYSNGQFIFCNIYIKK